jgi:hypothetical protein
MKKISLSTCPSICLLQICYQFPYLLVFLSTSLSILLSIFISSSPSLFDLSTCLFKYLYRYYVSTHPVLHSLSVRLYPLTCVCLSGQSPHLTRVCLSDQSPYLTRVCLSGQSPYLTRVSLSGQSPHQWQQVSLHRPMEGLTATVLKDNGKCEGPPLVRVPGYSSRSPGSIRGATSFSEM